MSLASWCFLLVKAWVLTRTKWQGARALQRFWQAATLKDGIGTLKSADRERVFLPLAEAAWRASEAEVPGALLARVERDERVLRELRLRQAMLNSLAAAGVRAGFAGVGRQHGAVRRLARHGLGIYHALSSIAASGLAMIENVTGPVGEALVMTAFGLVVAIPAVLAYNILGRYGRQISEELDGFAHDLHAFVCGKRK